MCASHNGSPSTCERCGGCCGAAGSTNEACGTRRRGRRSRRRGPGADAGAGVPELRGKHAGMLAGVRARGLAARHVSLALAPAAAPGAAARSRGASGEEPVLGVDGCGLPVHGMPLRAHRDDVRAARRSRAHGRAGGATARRSRDARRAVPGRRARGATTPLVMRGRARHRDEGGSGGAELRRRLGGDRRGGEGRRRRVPGRRARDDRGARPARAARTRAPAAGSRPQPAVPAAVRRRRATRCPAPLALSPAHRFRAERRTIAEGPLTDRGPGEHAGGPYRWARATLRASP